MLKLAVVRLDPSVEKRPREESVVKDKHNTLLRTGNGRMTVTLEKLQTKSQTHSGDEHTRHTIQASANDDRKHTSFNCYF